MGGATSRVTSPAMSLAAYAEARTTRAVELTGPDGAVYHVRLRAVTQQDLIAAGATRLVYLHQGSTEEGAQPAPSEAQLQGLAHLTEAVVAAGVCGQSADGGSTWEPLTIVLRWEQESPARGRLHVSRLAAFGVGCVADLARQVLELSGLTREAGERLGSFRGG